MKLELPVLTLEEYSLLNYMLGTAATAMYRLEAFFGEEIPSPEKMRDLAQKIFIETQIHIEPLVQPPAKQARRAGRGLKNKSSSTKLTQLANPKFVMSGDSVSNSQASLA